MSAMDDLQKQVTRAKVCAARCDAEGLASAMKDVQDWMALHGKQLAKDAKAKARVARDLSMLRDVASVMQTALSEALTAATDSGDQRGYGRSNRGREEASSILARRYG
jgi:hypothetical protein